MIEKLKMEQNPLSVTVEKIKEICPAAVTSEGKIDFEELKTALGDDVAADAIEKYEFTWVGKNAAKAEANRPIRKTLRPVVTDSKDWDNTKNLYIEGDNLDALKLLQESYLGKVKMIYIDPPYNTGNDFVYCDEFAAGCEEYLDKKGQCDSDGNRLFKNTETNGRFHSDWCSMIYSRLKIARDLLSDDGVIFVSIDDHEVANLRKIGNEIFGENNFIAQVIWERAFAPVNLMKHFSPSHDYLVVFAKNIEKAACNGIPRSDETNERYSNPDNDPRGVWSSSDISVGPAVESNIYTITTPSGRRVQPPAGRSWRLSEKAFSERLQDNRIWFGPDGDGVPRIKRFLSELRKTGVTPMTIWKYTEVEHSQTATQKLAQLFDGKKFFDYPKPVALIERCIQLYSNSDSVILDFFSGSATTAHAVMQLNAEDGGNRRFIMVQLPEKCEEESEAFKAGYKNICEIGKERIRRAGEKLKAENPDKDLDVGFRVLRIDSTNMKDVYYKPSDTTQKTLLDAVDNIKADRSDMDLLFGVMVDCGLPLDMPIETKTCDGKKYYVVNGGDYLVACFEPEISEKLVYEIANLKPTIAVFRDSSFADAKDKVNVTEIFKNITGRDDCVKVL